LNDAGFCAPRGSNDFYDLVGNHRRCLLSRSERTLKNGSRRLHPEDQDGHALRVQRVSNDRDHRFQAPNDIGVLKVEAIPLMRRMEQVQPEHDESKSWSVDSSLR